MKVLLATVGKSNKDFIKSGVEVYKAKLSHYLPFSLVEIASGNHSDSEKARIEEGGKLLKLVTPRDELVLLDHKGEVHSSESFAKILQLKMSHVNGTLIFAIGGPFGFSPEVYQKSVAKISLSPMIFSHQIVRLIFLEQLYRAMTILRNEPYHHP